MGRMDRNTYRSREVWEVWKGPGGHSGGHFARRLNLGQIGHLVGQMERPRWGGQSRGSGACAGALVGEIQVRRCKVTWRCRPPLFWVQHTTAAGLCQGACEKHHTVNLGTVGGGAEIVKLITSVYAGVPTKKPLGDFGRPPGGFSVPGQRRAAPALRGCAARLYPSLRHSRRDDAPSGRVGG
jgi:hypothetical protein